MAQGGGTGWGGGGKPERPAPPALGKPGFKGEDGAASLQTWGGSGLFSGRAAGTWGQDSVM